MTASHRITAPLTENDSIARTRPAGPPARILTGEPTPNEIRATALGLGWDTLETRWIEAEFEAARARS